MSYDYEHKLFNQSAEGELVAVSAHAIDFELTAIVLGGTMSKVVRRALHVCALIAALVAVNASAASAAEDEGRYIVVFNDSVEHPGTVAHAQVDESDGDMTAFFSRALDGYAATLPTDQVDDIRRDPEVDYVTIDHQVGLLEEEVNLETFNNGGVEIFEASIPTGIQRTFASTNKALDIDGVDDVRADADVAVIDTGIDYEHPDLNVAGRTICTTGTCVDNSGKDGHSHGTHVAGTIGAIDNNIGVVGVAPGARMWGVKVLNDSGSGQESWIIKGVEWVTAHASTIEVANMSLGCACSMPALDTAINKSVEAGVVYSVAAGNSSSDAKFFSPASNPNVITVSAVADYDGKSGGKAAFTCANYGLDDRSASFSNYGGSVDVAAPGVCTVSTTPGNTYGTKSGTSMAAPHVAGAAAILASLSNPNSKAAVEAIRNTIVAKGNTEWTDTSGDGIKEPLLDVSNESTFKLTSPVNTALPVATPVTPLQAVPESTTTGTWTNSPTSYSYQWQVCNGTGSECTNISGATKSTYTPVEADVEHTLRVNVTAKNAGGEGTATSAATNKVRPIGQVTEYSLPAGSRPQGITAGPDGNLWFIASGTNKVGKITTTGTKTEYALGEGVGAHYITTGPDGNLWFTEYLANKVVKITTSGAMTEYSLPAESHPTGITTGPDGNLWYLARGTNKIGKITTSGTKTEYARAGFGTLADIVAGPDGNLWFDEEFTRKVGKITTSGTITEYGPLKGNFAKGVAAGPDKNLWYSVGSEIAKVTTGGAITEYALPAGLGAIDITAGPDGNLWYASSTGGGKIGRITTGGTVTEYSLPGESRPAGVAVGSDSNIWFTSFGTDKIANITP